MKNHLYTCVALCCVLAFSQVGYSQEAVTATDQVLQFSSSIFSKLDQKAASVNKQLQKQTVKYLLRLEKKEAKLKRKLYKIDSLKAKELFGNAANKYAQLTDKLKNASSNVPGHAKQYIPYVDSISTALTFLDKNKQLINNAIVSQGSPLWNPARFMGQVKDINQLQNKLQVAEEVRAFIKERKQQINDALSKYTNLPKSITKSYQGYAKELYYYQAQIKEYKEILNDPSKIEQKALELLNKVPAFTDFMQKNSLLASLFPQPANYGTPAALAGLQTRGQIQQLIGNRLSSGGPNAQDMLQQQIQNAQTQLKQLKDKVNQLGGSGADIDMPDFIPNNQKIKRFKDRIELGTNLQTTRSNTYFPTTSDIALSAGYRLNDKSIIGVGGSYRFGLGRNIRQIAFTSEGIGFRSYADYKIRGSIWFSAGAEMNYRARFNSIEALKNESAWAKSILAGLSKKYRVSKKVKGELKLLYDALWQQQIPRGQPVVFRVGYAIK